MVLAASTTLLQLLYKAKLKKKTTRSTTKCTRRHMAFSTTKKIAAAAVLRWPQPQGCIAGWQEPAQQFENKTDRALHDGTLLFQER
jgi:hypothetical protein